MKKMSEKKPEIVGEGVYLGRRGEKVPFDLEDLEQLEYDPRTEQFWVRKMLERMGPDQTVVRKWRTPGEWGFAGEVMTTTTIVMEDEDANRVRSAFVYCCQVQLNPEVALGPCIECKSFQVVNPGLIATLFIPDPMPPRFSYPGGDPGAGRVM